MVCFLLQAVFVAESVEVCCPFDPFFDEATVDAKVAGHIDVPEPRDGDAITIGGEW